MQFGATSKVGFSGVVVSLKILLQSRREHGVGSCVIFIDLVKLFDSVKN